MGQRSTFGTGTASGWQGWAHPPFHCLALLPFLLGTLLAWRLAHRFSLPVLLLSLCGIALVMVSTHAIAADHRHTQGHAPLTKGHPFPPSPSGLAERWASATWVLRIGLVSLALAAVIALVLQFLFQAGPLTFLMGCLGALPGLCYATRTCRWLQRGFGEGIVGLCYGWLPITAGFYVQTGAVAPCIHKMALPIVLALFNVVLIHEYADEGVPTSGDVHLLRRLGKTGGMVLYVGASVLSWFWMVGLVHTGMAKKALYLYLPALALSMVVSLMMAGRKYENPFLREWIVGLNIAVYLGTTLAFLLAYL